MRVGIITGFSKKHSAGLEEFLLGLLAGLEAVRPPDVEYLIYTSAASDLPEALAERSIKGFRVIRVGFGNWWKQFGLIFAPRADVYLWNGPMVSPFFFPHRSAVLVYDFAYRHYGSRGAAMLIMDMLSALAFRRAAKIIAISQATADDIQKLFGVHSDKIVIIYSGIKNFSNTAEEPISIPVNGYFLFVGTMKERKNVLNLVRGFGQIASQIPQDLLIAGRCDFDSSYGKQVVAAIQEASISNRVRFLGPVSDPILKYLYRHAVAFVFPSAFEGFGMPVVEAMIQGIPVLTSNVSSLPEAAGDAALLVDPFDPAAIAAGLLRLTQEPTLRGQLIEKGRINSARFSWEKFSKALNEVLGSI